MEKQRWEESERRRAEETRTEKRKNEKKEDAGARKDKKVATRCLFHMICGSGGSKSRLAKAAGAKPSRSRFPSQNAQNTPFSNHFWTFRRSDVVSRGMRKGLCTLSKISKTWGFCGISKNDGRHGAFEEDLESCISRGRHSARDMFIRDVRRSGRWFPEKGCILEHQIFRFAKMILRDRRSTSYDLASLFRGRRSTLDRWSGNITKRIGTRPSALHSTFHAWRKSRRIAPFLMLSTWNIEEVSQNCFLLMLSPSKMEEALQTCFVFELADRKKERKIDR